MTNAGQLPLNITPCLSYSAKNFIAHSGVSNLLSQVTALLELDPPKFTLIYGESRYGKTHLSIALADRLIAVGLRPILIEGDEFSSLISSGAANFIEGETLMVDDAQKLFSKVQVGESGPVVKFFEELRVKGVGLVLFSSKAVSELPCDEHVLSRLRGCVQLSIGMPEAEMLPKVMDTMAKQRGLALGGRRLKFVERRVQRSIPEIERYLTRLQHLSQVMGKKVSFRTLGDALKPIRTVMF